ncbi:VWA domain-containing protein [Aquabacter sp. L1I39]|uniref:vWA domain-containing protein n=1 Tax=Aquabacter sp. L1I39 TaxID=2820278 RepID=UPI001ADCB476|nr:VWA domain-containing protein [Aquabacter sp. L1I39]QTL01786.1 VWA domain-containing protein [Aquabacter sp. L1I39]
MADGRLAENVLHFGRALRAAGLPVGPGSILDATQALAVAGVGSREDVYWTLHAVFVTRREHHEVFHQAFGLFWRRRDRMEKLIALLSPEAIGAKPKEKGLLRRVEEAFAPAPAPRAAPEPPEMEWDARLTASAQEVLRTKDFAQMSADEARNARASIAQMRMPDDLVPTRRFAPDPRGRRPDLRAALRAGLATGGLYLPLRHRAPRWRPPPAVALVDISGSMADYSRPVLHFLHALTAQRKRVYSFLFGTRLTNVTRALRHKDPDEALEQVAAAAQDWSGGTRIAASLRAFNKDWSRRVMAQNPVVLLVTDGLERDVGPDLEEEIGRLHRSCRRLIWLNPLLRYAGFEPKAKGVRALLPHVDEFRPVHNLDSLDALVKAFSAPSVTAHPDRDGPVRPGRAR